MKYTTTCKSCGGTGFNPHAPYLCAACSGTGEEPFDPVADRETEGTGDDAKGEPDA